MIRRPINFDSYEAAADNEAPMEVKLALLADAANLSREGKLNILGAFTNIVAQAFPARHPEMQLVLSMETSVAETGLEKRMDIKLLDVDGAPVASVAGSFKLPPNPRQGRRIHLGIILPLRDVVFPKEGDYVFAVVLDGRTEAEIQLSVTMVSGEGDSNAG